MTVTCETCGEKFPSDGDLTAAGICGECARALKEESEGPSSSTTLDIVPRSRAGALVLSLLQPGLGQVYNGQMKKIAAIWAGWIVVLVIARLAGVPFHFWGFVAIGALGFVLYVALAFDAIRVAATLGWYIPKPYNRWFVYVGIIAVVWLAPRVLGMRSAIGIRALKLPTESMSPGLEFGDYFMVRLVAGKNYANNRGDILAFYYPGDNRTIYAKRVVGFPGELVEFRNGRLHIDGRLVRAEWAQYGEHNSRAAGVNFGPYEVPDATLFVIGDNLANSADSRVWGSLPRSNLIGVAQYIYFSRNKNRVGMDLRVHGE